MAIDRKRHENLIIRLEKLRSRTDDVEVVKLIESEIELLSETYERYISFLADAKKQDKLYRVLHEQINATIFKKRKDTRASNSNFINKTPTEQL